MKEKYWDSNDMLFLNYLINIDTIYSNRYNKHIRI